MCGSLMPSEIEAAFGTRWPTTLRPIDPGDLRAEIYGVVRPGVISTLPPTTAAYQGRKFTVQPRQKAKCEPLSLSPSSPRRTIEPMPLVF